MKTETKPKIVHIDDDYDFVNLFRMFFSRSFNILSFTSASESLEKVDFRDIDAVVLDYDMPELNGLELLKTIRAKAPHLPVVMLTGQGNESISRDAFICGASDYFMKNLHDFILKEKFINAVKSAINKSKTERALIEMENKYQSIIENMQDAFYRSDKEGKLIMVSPSGCGLLGYNEIEMLGRPVSDFYENPEIRSELLRQIKEKGKISNFIINLKRSDGSIITVSTNSHIIFDTDNTYNGIEGIFRDITDVKKAENALILSEEKYRKLVDHSQTGVFIIQDAIMQFANNAFLKMIGYTEDEL
ncbi:MAG: PAS domain S-box protein, partial [Firmicutes bacterium]|nr:PAS domain S-box protein [Bacillota bacterium]